MNIFRKINSVIRKIWLASIGAIGVSQEKTSDTIKKATDSGEQFIDELIVEGAGLEHELTEKLQLRTRLDHRISALNNALGRANSKEDDQLVLMSYKLDQLTIVVNQLVAKKMAEKKSGKKPRKAVIKKTADKSDDDKALFSAAQPSS